MTRDEQRIIFDRLHTVERKLKETGHLGYRSKAAVLRQLIYELGLTEAHCGYLQGRAAAA